MEKEGKKRLLSKSEKNEELFELQSKNKKVKIEQTSMSQIQAVRQSLCQRFTLEQIEALTQSILNLKDYLKIASLDIKHQQRSIATLPVFLLQQFPELNTRVDTLMSKCQYNMNFINCLIDSYRPLLFKKNPIENIVNGKSTQIQNKQHSHQHSHSHSHVQYNYTSVITMIHHMIKQWSSQPEIDHILRILTCVQQNWNFKEINCTKILVVGCGMGRIIYELQNAFEKNNIKIQGHESQAQMYLCAEYFLGKCDQQRQIYPYIHNFSNFLMVQDPYRKIQIPFKIRSKDNFIPLTLGKFTKLYRSHLENWNIVVTIFTNEQVEDVLIQIKTIYGILKQGGLWIDLCTSNFLSNVLPLTYKQYQQILNKSQFKLISEIKTNETLFYDKKCIMNQYRISHCRVMQK